MPRLTPLYPKASRLTHSLHSTNKFIAHLNRLVSSTSHLDAILGVVYYTLSLLLLLLPRFFRRPPSKKDPPRLSLSLFLLPLLLRRAVNISRLLELINTVRTFIRVSTGLVGIISSASLLRFRNSSSSSSSSSSKIKSDKTGKRLVIIARSGVDVAQIALLSVYQIYENIGFLTDQGILLSSSLSSSGNDDDTIITTASVVKNNYLTSSRAWMGSVVFSILSTLLATTTTTTATTTTTTTTTTATTSYKNTKEKEWWWKRLVVPVVVNLPLSAHASFEKGLLADEVVAFMGLVVSGLGLRKGWRDTEEEEEEEEEEEGAEGKEERKEE